MASKASNVVLPGRVHSRISKELQRFNSNPDFGITLSQRPSELHIIDATIHSLEDSPYEKGVFRVLIILHANYPFEPPQVKLVTPIYHPNIDSAGLICLDLLKSPPSGTWRPIHNIATLVTSLRQLLLAPNPSDPLMPEIAKEWISNKSAFEAKAREWTRKYAYGSLSNGKEQN